MAVLDLNFPVIVFMNPGASREETLNALKMMGMNNVHPAGNFMACREMMRHKPNAMLVLDRRHAPVREVLLVNEHVGAVASDVRLIFRRHAITAWNRRAAHSFR